LGKDQREALQQIVNEVNAGKIKTIEKVAQAIQDRVYLRSYYKPWGSPEHYQAVGLKYVYDANLKKMDVPMELRAVWIQDSAERFNLIARMIEGRIAYLNKLNDPIVYTSLERVNFSDSELKTRFAIYIDEAGMDYEEFKSLLPQNVVSAQFDDFVRTDISLERQIEGIEKYWDLIAGSAWVQKRIVQLLSDPMAKKNQHAVYFIKRIKSIALSDQRSRVSQFFVDVAKYLKLSSVNYSPEAQLIFKKMLRAIESPAQQEITMGTPSLKEYRSSCQKVFQ